MRSRSSSSSPSAFLRALLLAGLPATAAYAQVQVAENLLISLSGTTYNTGNDLWTNSGTIPGDFSTDGTTPTRLSMDGQIGVLLDGQDHFIGPNSIPGIESNGSVSIEVWAYQGNIRNEETLVAWGRRGSDAQNMSFNYGTDDRWGSVGHWAGTDMGWGPNDPVGSNGQRAPGTPTEGQWHHLAYTFDGTIQKVYKDGVLMNQDQSNLNIFGGLPIQIGAQRSNVSPFNVEPALRLSGLIGQVRVHDGVLTQTQVTQNFDAEKLLYHYDAAGSYLPKAQATLVKAPVHRYTFNGLVINPDETINIPDVAGGPNPANADVKGFGATVTLTEVDLPGGDPSFAAYVDLPNGVISGTLDGGAGYSSATYETWITVQSNQNWSRVMDFGASDAGEITGPGGGFSSSRTIMLSANNGTAPDMRFEIAGVAAGPGAGTRDAAGNSLGTEMHIAVVYDEFFQQWRWYRDGELQESFESAGGNPFTIPDVNNWLGRSNWSQDANTDAMYNEFRIYDYALSVEELRGNLLAGPDLVNVPEPGTLTALVGGAALLVGLQRSRRNSRRDLGA
jgi:hypothetical protein